MTFDEVFAQIQDLLQREQRLSYRGLKRRLDLHDGYLEDLKEEHIGDTSVAIDEDGRFLVWVGASPAPGSTFQVPRAPQSPDPDSQPERLSDPRGAEAERRQLTVMFCDLVGST